MKITDLKCTVLGQNPVVRITTDEGIDGLGEVENSKPYLKTQICSSSRSWWAMTRPMSSA